MGCEYREGLNIVHCEAGVATNTIPDEAWMFVNFRFAPDRSVNDALTYMLDVLALPQGVTYTVDDAVPERFPVCPSQLHRNWWLPLVGISAQNTAGLMWPGSPNWAYQRSISARPTGVCP